MAISPPLWTCGIEVVFNNCVLMNIPRRHLALFCICIDVECLLSVLMGWVFLFGGFRWVFLFGGFRYCQCMSILSLHNLELSEWEFWVICHICGSLSYF